MAVPDRAPAEAVGAAAGPLDRFPAVGLVLTGCVSVQFGAGLAITLFDDLGPAGTSVLRIGMGALIMALAFRPALRGIRAADARLLVLFGLTLGVMNLCFYEALDRIPLGVAVTIEFAGPLGVAVAFSRKPRDVLWVVLAAAGILLLANPWGADAIDGVGLAFALIAAACWALYILLAAKAGERFSGADGITIAMLVAALVPIVPGVIEAGDALIEPKWLVIGAAVGLLSSAIPYGLEMEALRRLPRRVFGVLMSLEPAIAALAGFLILGQGLAAYEIVAIGFVVAASAGASRDATPPIDA